MVQEKSVLILELKEYMKLCRTAAMLPDGACKIKAFVPEELTVTCKGWTFYPLSVEKRFDGEGREVYLAHLHSMNANSVLIEKLKNVYKREL